MSSFAEVVRKFAPQRTLFELSTRYAELATEVSKRVEEFETFLRELPGKTSVFVIGEDGLVLGYDRIGNGWGLTFGYSPGNGPKNALIGASVEIKAQAIPLFEPLIRQLVEVQSKLVEILEAGLEKRRSDFLNFLVQQKGGDQR